MGDVVAFIGVVALIVVLPGPDMALVLQNGLARGRRAAVETAVGINAGLLVWAVAARRISSGSGCARLEMPGADRSSTRPRC